MNPTAYIALGLGVFFLVVSIIKGFASRAERRRLADVRSAVLHGGTPDNPVHLESPFAAPAKPEASAAGAATPDEESYVWE